MDRNVVCRSDVSGIEVHFILVVVAQDGQHCRIGVGWRLSFRTVGWTDPFDEVLHVPKDRKFLAADRVIRWRVRLRASGDLPLNRFMGSLESSIARLQRQQKLPMVQALR